MAKVVKTYENETIITTLTFREQVFTLTQPPFEDGVRNSIELCLSIQIKNCFGDDENIEEICDLVDIIDFGDDTEIEESLEELVNYE